MPMDTSTEEEAPQVLTLLDALTDPTDSVAMRDVLRRCSDRWNTIIDGDAFGSNERKVVHYHSRCGRLPPLPDLGVIIRSRRAFDVVTMELLASQCF